MTHATVFSTWKRWGGRILVLLAFAVGVIVLILWLAGKFAPKVPATPLAASTAAGRDPYGFVRPPSA